MKLKSNEQNKADVSFNFAHSFVIVKVVLSTKKIKTEKRMLRNKSDFYSNEQQRRQWVT